jgi:2'-5' RNA ligase
MHTIISELDPETSGIVRDLWEKLFNKCGLKGVYLAPTPHFTWLAADEFDIDQVKSVLHELVDQVQSFKLHTFGIGVFSGKEPVLYLPMVKSLEMISLHCQIWKHIAPLSEGLKQYYSPKIWVPHITLALKDLTQETLACAVNAIAFEQIELYVKVDNLAIAELDDALGGKILHHYKFRSKEVFF